ncbi:MAG: hypothetical protein ACRDPS_18905 [Nocardioides sp.]|uniref:hypothetical protein n=1 Tax=Nocardioides sp. TaxID=35761 RepID=UPI003D6A93A6
MTSFWLAIDHSDDAKFHTPDGTDIRSEILELIAESPGWGIVVRPDHDRLRIPGDAVCVGLPDIHEVAELRPPDGGSGVVKVGFHHPEDGCSRAATAILGELRHYDRVFLEPYCDSSDCLAQLAGTATSLGPQDVVLKVRVNEDGLDVVKRAEIGATAWVARSDGMSWADYSARLPTARDLGAVGVMVGRAIWGDTVGLAADARRGSILDRMEAITRTF